MRQIAGRELLGGAFFGLVLPAVVLVAWMLGTHELFYPHGGGLSLVMLGVPLCAVAGCVGLWWFLLIHLEWTWHDVGFVKPRRSLWHLMWEAPVIMLVAALIAALLGYLVGVEPRNTDKTTSGVGLAPGAMIFTVVAVTLLVPVIEEVVFRRLLYGWLAQRLQIMPAVLLAGVIFGACHISPALMMYVLPWGIGVTALRVWHGSLWASWVAHAVNNLAVSLIALSVA